MASYLVRVKFDNGESEIVGFYSVSSLTELGSMVDEFIDPHCCEYAAIKSFGFTYPPRKPTAYNNDNEEHDWLSFDGMTESAFSSFENYFDNDARLRWKDLGPYCWMCLETDCIK